MSVYDHETNHGRDACDDGIDDEWCQRCGGDGFIHDCGEDTCCCANPDEDDCYPCPDCGGTGCA
jgi:hypothetical protein